jgi:ankyrin repeat protein
MRLARCVGATHTLLASARRQYSKTALVFAAEKGHAAIAKLALERGADANAKDFVRPTSVLPLPSCECTLTRAACTYQYQTGSLHYAAQGGFVEIVTALLDAGANVDLPDEARARRRRQPLHRVR